MIFKFIKKITKYLLRRLGWKLIKIKIKSPNSHPHADPDIQNIKCIMEASGILHIGAHRGSEAAVYDWFKKKVFVEYFEDIIFSESFKSRNYYNVEIVQKMWKDYLKNKNNFTSFYLWQIINFEIWHRIFIDNNSIKNMHKFNY